MLQSNNSNTRKNLIYRRSLGNNLHEFYEFCYNSRALQSIPAVSPNLDMPYPYGTINDDLRDFPITP